MKSIIRWAVHNSPAMNTLMIGVLVVGTVSLISMRREVFPQFELEIILVSVPYPGASPEEVEEGVCQKIEEAVRSIDGIKKQTAIAQEGMGYLVLELESFVDVQKTLNEVRSEVDRIPSFPELTEDPEIKQIIFREAAIQVGIVGPEDDDLAGELKLREITEQVRRDILRLPSVSQANIVGARPYQIDVEISEDQLRKYGLSLAEVAEIIRRENLELPGGRIKTETQEVLIRGKNKQLLGAEIAKIPLVTRPDGVVLTVQDLGTVQDAFEDVTAISRIDGQPGLTISVDRSKTEDLLRIVDEVKEYVATLSLPAGYEPKTWADQSVDVRDRMNLLTKNGIQGLALVFLVLAVFLDLKLSFWVAMGIPISLLGAGGILLLGGQTMNMLSMFAFLMALGIVVDDAIVIGENIYAHRSRGVSSVQAAVDGTLEVLPSVLASVSTTIIAFTPLLFVSGVMGKFIAVMPVAVIAMLVISLVESSIILPCHLAHPRASNEERVLGSVFRPIGFAVGLVMAPLYHAILRLFGWLNRKSESWIQWFVDGYYIPLLRWSLHHPGIVISSAVSLMLMSFGLVTSGVTPFVVFPKTDTNQITAAITYPDGTPGHTTDETAREVEQAIYEVERALASGPGSLVETVRRSVGQVRDPTAIGPEGRSSGSHLARIDVELIESSKREVTSLEIVEKWRELAGNVPGAESMTFGSLNMGPGGTPIEFRLVAKPQHMRQLEEAIEKTKDRLGEYAGIVDIRDDSRPGKWEFQLKIGDKAKALGISLADLAQTVRAAFYGEEVMRLQRGRHEVKLMVRYPESERKSLSDFEEVWVRSPDGIEYSLTELADVTVKRGYAEINRIDQLRSIAILADVQQNEGNARETVEDLRRNFMPGLLAEYPEIDVLWEGQQEQTNESVTSLFRGFLVAILAMFVLLTVEFRSYFQPLIILAIIPFGVVGAIWGHAFMGLTLTLFTLFGLVALTGVVVNDSIVLIDFINHRIEAGVPLVQSLLAAGRRRFRPVILTSATTIAGLTPIMTETSFQAQFLIPLAATLVFGLLCSTAMVLVLIPTFYFVCQRFVNGSPMESERATVSHHQPTPVSSLPPLEAEVTGS